MYPNVPQQPDRLAVAIPGLYPTLNTLYRWGGWMLTLKPPPLTFDLGDNLIISR